MKTKEVKYIFYLCRLLGIDEPGRHVLQEAVTGKESLKEMSLSDKKALIKALEEEALKRGIQVQQKRFMTSAESIKRGKNKNPRVHGDKIYNFASWDQRAKIKALSRQIYGYYDEIKLDFYCRKTFKRPFSRISSDDAIKLIEIQKSILSRKTRPEVSC